MMTEEIQSTPSFSSDTDKRLNSIDTASSQVEESTTAESDTTEADTAKADSTEANKEHDSNAIYAERALELAKTLINIPSITPNDNGCQQQLIQHLLAMNFTITPLSSGNVTNFWAQRGHNGPLFVFAGHTDVVPPGPETKWRTPPFMATVHNDRLYGRGAADMKAALAAMVIACQQFIDKHPNHLGSIGFMITSDEEGTATDGTTKIVEYLENNNINIDWCLIGEASSQQELGDAVKIGRRGSLHGELQVMGKQGHIAYPHLAENPIHNCFKALDQLTHIEWDQGNEHFSPTSFQIYNISADTGATNIIPGALTARFNFRFSPASTPQQLKDRLQKTLDDHALRYHIEWNLASQPFYSEPGQLFHATQQSIQTILGIETHANTIGGTSDGRFIARLGCEIVELGFVNKTIHQVNEHIHVPAIKQLTTIYANILEQLLL